MLALALPLTKKVGVPCRPSVAATVWMSVTWRVISGEAMAASALVMSTPFATRMPSMPARSTARSLIRAS